MMEEMEYLRLPPILAKQVQHPEEYIRKNDPKEPTRRIFKNVPITQDERKQLQQLKDNLSANRIEINPDSQTDEVLPLQIVLVKLKLFRFYYFEIFIEFIKVIQFLKI